MFKRLFPYILLLAISLVPRFVSLSTVPTSLSHDEVDLIIQAHSVRLTGKDLSGSWSPLSLLPNAAIMAELGPVINLPALSLLPNSLFSAHVTTAILGSCYPLLIVLLLFSWGVSKQVACLSGFMLALSPWHLLFSRTTLEQPTSLFFYTLSWIFLSKIFSKNKNLKVFLLSTFSFIIFYLIGFYTYHGYKFALPLLTVFVAIFNYFKSTNPKKTKILAVVLILIASLYLRTYLNQSSYVGRQSEIIFLDQSR
ncbi:MAG: phospholipid carrier-dependent glycosyltransferase, partial [Candidatus Moraniibacteriota bacterium]